MNSGIVTGTDGYKIEHRPQFHKLTRRTVSTWTPRKSRIKNINKVVFFGLQAFIKNTLMKAWKEDFFDKPEEIAVQRYYRRIKNYSQPGTTIEVDHIRALHRLGYLPIAILALPEGVASPIRVPQSVVYNTIDEFFWLPGYLETPFSCENWKPSTSATQALEYRKIFTRYALITAPERLAFVRWQGHDFSMRGMSGYWDAMSSGSGHLIAGFYGSDTIPAVDWLEEYYNADCEKEIIAGGVAATEHAVMCTNTGFYVWDKYQGDWSHIGEAEFEVFKQLITVTYPTGIISIVSDTWDLWRVIVKYLKKLKKEILARDGKVVIRPDSGDPCDILCGYNTLDQIPEGVDPNHPSVKGVVELLYEEFGGTMSSTGFKLLNDKIGTIYGDSITMDRAVEICERLMKKKFASVNWVAGIGSFTYQFVTRDTFGFAQKATFCVVGQYDIEIFKDPITDDGTKKSARGFVSVHKDNEGEYFYKDQTTWEDLHNCELKMVFYNGELLIDHTLADIRSRTDEIIMKEFNLTQEALAA